MNSRGGMAQRVGIAAALAGLPKLLIADEPTTALDVTVQAEILELLHDLREEMGLALILISHNWGVVADLCDKVIVMYAGQVVERATLSTILREPRHPYTAALLASDSTNAYWESPACTRWLGPSHRALACRMSLGSPLPAFPPQMSVDRIRSSKCRCPSITRPGVFTVTNFKE